MQRHGEQHKCVSSTSTCSNWDVLGWQCLKCHVPHLAALGNLVPSAASPTAGIGRLWAFSVALVVSGDPRRIAAFSLVCKIASELRVGGEDLNMSILMAQKTIS